MGWPDLVEAYVGGVRAALGVPASISTKNFKLEELPGFVRVTRGPGSDDKIYDSTLIDFDVITTSYDASHDLAERLREYVLSTHNTLVGGHPVGSVETASAPMEVDWGNPNLVRFVYSARISTARQQ